MDEMKNKLVVYTALFGDSTSELYNLEVFKKGTRAECKEYLLDIPETIRYLFSVEPVDEDAMRLI